MILGNKCKLNVDPIKLAEVCWAACEQFDVNGVKVSSGDTLIIICNESIGRVRRYLFTMEDAIGRELNLIADEFSKS
jgi:hypothetical protein